LQSIAEKKLNLRSKKMKIVVFTGAGISAESGIKTFRDSDGLWEQYRIEDVATPEAFNRNPKLVLDFYNERRKQVIAAKPNAAHYAIAELETKFEVQVITQNIDDLHERAGSKKVLHLHGEILKARSTADSAHIIKVTGDELNLGDFCPKGSQLRPHIVWFGELVPMMDLACELASEASIFIVVGTSLNVYPAANLLNFAPLDSPIFLVDPNTVSSGLGIAAKHIKEKAGTGVPALVKKLLSGAY
jgi:NAD-dependent deacetylase